MFRVGTSRRSIIRFAAFMLLFLALAGANFSLVRQNRILRGDILNKGQQYLGVGNSVPVLRGMGLDKNIKVIAYAGQAKKDTLFLVFSPFCGWCKINLPNWQAILDQASDRYRIVAISIARDKTAEFVREHGLGKAEVIVEPDPRDLLTYKLQLTPQTILVDSNGVVKKNWMGAFSSEGRQEIESTLGIHLPNQYFETTAQQISAGLRSK